MKWAALATWLLTASGGFVLLATWLANGGLTRRRATGSRIRPALILPHFGLAATGLVVWIVYAVADADALAWVAFAVLAVVATIGWTMFGIWSRQRGLRRPTVIDPQLAPPEQRFPVPVVVAHGLLAVTTVVLVFLTALTA